MFATAKSAKLFRLNAMSLLVLTVISQPRIGFSLASKPANGRQLAAASARDGQHDFDFNFGVWHTHIRRILDPLSGSADSIELNGTVTVRKIWDGRAQLEEIEADGPKGHWEGLTLFLYNPQSHQWSQSYLNSKMAAFSPPLVGSFNAGRGELFAQDTFHDKSILVRGTWSDITPDSHHFEEAYSEDGGRTWAPAFVAQLTRDRDKTAEASDIAFGAEPMSAGPEGHDFDFDLGTLKTHSSRLLHPLTGSSAWADMDGYTVVRRVWAGRANLAEYKANGPAGQVELLALRWFNPNTHEWNIDFATPNVGMLGIPGIGKFKNGRCEFYDQEQINGRYVLVRFSIWKISDDSAQSEQAFSDDGGKTWETNWINKYTRARPSETGARSKKGAANEFGAASTIAF
jgi:hypothetical protein